MDIENARSSSVNLTPPVSIALYSAYKNEAIQYKWPMIGQYTD